MEINVAKKTVLIFGASGLVGGHLLKLLLNCEAYDVVRSFGRRELPIQHPKLKQYVIDMDNPRSFESMVTGNDLFICLGTTMAKAGSKEAFYKVDYTYCYEIAKIASHQKVNQLLIVTAAGSDPDSMFFYSQVKGELERDLKKLKFWGLHIFQPSLLIGDREERRFGESVAAFIGKGIKFISGDLLKKYTPIEGRQVAAAMIQAANKLRSGTFVYTSDELKDMSSEYHKELE